MIYKRDGENIPVRRSLLWVSGNDITNMADARKWGADVVTLDLEDTVTVADKPKARKVIGKQATVSKDFKFLVVGRATNPFKLSSAATK